MADGRKDRFECKWTMKKKDKPPKKWLESSPGATFELVTQDSYLDFVG
jgi:hypothetical protein